LLLDHANKAGKKILMSGGGRCNFTNYDVTPDKFLSHNPHFCKSALKSYTQWDFIALVQKYHIPFHEKKLGQLFCDNKAKDILHLLLEECDNAGVDLRLNTSINAVNKIDDDLFQVNTSAGNLRCQSLVIATGGLSIPTMGATSFAYKIAEQFGVKVWPTSAGLVPFTLGPDDKKKYATLSGVSFDANVSYRNIAFDEGILITHRGLSGPAILQISSYWQPGGVVQIDTLPEINLYEVLVQLREKHRNQKLKSVLNSFLPKRVVEVFLDENMGNKTMQLFSHEQLKQVQRIFQDWKIKPAGTEGYRTAEVTLGGIDCDAISSKTMETNAIKGLYFIGEALDVTGWLGGYNFQWAWSSAWAAGQVV